MKKPDEIKRGLECCINGECNSKRKTCPYRKASDCASAALIDALAYIRELEAKVAELEKVKKERDRYWDFIRAMECESCSGDCNKCVDSSAWTWSGEELS